MRPLEEFEHVTDIESGMNDCEIARATGIPRRTVLDWRHKSVQGWVPGLDQAGRRSNCPICDDAVLEARAYSYLLGLYLGDGCLAQHPRGVYRLRISLDQKYPRIINECKEAINAIKTHGKPASQVTIPARFKGFSPKHANG